MHRLRPSLLLVALALPAAAGADESAVRLMEGPGRELVVANCSACHSLDYIQMNSPFLDRAGWEKSVEKMVKVMGAPVRPDDVPVIIDYLAGHYGK